jgi:hypothetical protein
MINARVVSRLAEFAGLILAYFAVRLFGLVGIGVVGAVVIGLLVTRGRFVASANVSRDGRLGGEQTSTSASALLISAHRRVLGLNAGRFAIVIILCASVGAFLAWKYHELPIERERAWRAAAAADSAMDELAMDRLRAGTLTAAAADRVMMQSHYRYAGAINRANGDGRIRPLYLIAALLLWVTALVLSWQWFGRTG